MRRRVAFQVPISVRHDARLNKVFSVYPVSCVVQAAELRETVNQSH